MSGYLFCSTNLSGSIYFWIFNVVSLYFWIQVSSLSHVQLFATPWTAGGQAFPSLTNSQSLLKLMSIELVIPFNHLILCLPLLLPPSIFPSIRVFSNESVLCIRWPKYWSFSFSISPSNESSGLIAFRIGWFDLLAVQGTLKSLLQHHSSKACIWIQRKSTIFNCSLLVYRSTMDLFVNSLCISWSWWCFLRFYSIFYIYNHVSYLPALTRM